MYLLAENEQIVQDNGTDVDTVDMWLGTPMLLQDGIVSSRIQRFLKILKEADPTAQTTQNRSKQQFRGIWWGVGQTQKRSRKSPQEETQKNPDQWSQTQDPANPLKIDFVLASLKGWLVRDFCREGHSKLNNGP